MTGPYTGVNRRPDCKHTKDVMMRLLIKQASVINSKVNRKQLVLSKDQNNRVPLALGQYCRGWEVNDRGLDVVWSSSCPPPETFFSCSVFSLNINETVYFVFP